MALEGEGTALARGVGDLPPIRTGRGVQRGAACIRDTRHTVAGLVQWRRLGLADPQILARHPDLSQADLDAAWAYHDRNCAEIDRVIQFDEEA